MRGAGPDRDYSMIWETIAMTIRLSACCALLAVLMTGCAGSRAPIAPSSTAATSADWSKATRIDVVLESFAFAPDHLVFARGRSYRLHLKNRADGGHNFDAPAFFRTVELKPDATSAAVRKSGGVVELPAGGEADVYFVPDRAGRYPLICSHFLHESFGMEGDIVVR